MASKRPATATASVRKRPASCMMPSDEEEVPSKPWPAQSEHGIAHDAGRAQKVPRVQEATDAGSAGTPAAHGVAAAAVPAAPATAPAATSGKSAGTSTLFARPGERPHDVEGDPTSVGAAAPGSPTRILHQRAPEDPVPIVPPEGLTTSPEARTKFLEKSNYGHLHVWELKERLAALGAGEPEIAGLAEKEELVELLESLERQQQKKETPLLETTTVTDAAEGGA
eukprot:TRINITY_DN14778_c0_g1_i1.p1 TRINITY_DN14778_c0_g1~~TRINITY_DN14778_c0_g1_i1.p1  ORF type:complete len:253 (+),score=42.76 TRINITY_DN14778_c0_g1_i1:87-761(+)